MTIRLVDRTEYLNAVNQLNDLEEQKEKIRSDIESKENHFSKAIAKIANYGTLGHIEGQIEHLEAALDNYIRK